MSEIIKTSPSGLEEKSRKIFSRGFSGHEIFLIGGLRRRGLVGKKRQLEAVDDFADYDIMPPGEKTIRPFGAEELLMD